MQDTPKFTAIPQPKLKTRNPNAKPAIPNPIYICVYIYIYIYIPNLQPRDGSVIAEPEECAGVDVRFQGLRVGNAKRGE